MDKSFFPIINDLKTYNLNTFLSDLNGGILVAILLIPQGLAYAFLAGVPPIYGLYGALIPLFVYAFLGTSTKLSIGPVAISAILVLQGVSQIAEPFTENYVQLVILCGLLIGLVQILFGLLKFGYLVNFISHPVLAGFTSAAAIIIIINQLKDILGISIPRFKYSFQTCWYAIQHLLESHILSIVFFGMSFVFMILLKKIHKKIPYALIVVIVSILTVHFLKLESTGLNIIGHITPGVPDFSIPFYSIETIKDLLPVVLTVAIIGIVESISIGKVLEDKTHSIKPNQELFALGFSKFFGAFFSAIPSSGSFSRSAINDQAGTKTQVSSLIASLFVLLTLLFLTSLFYALPKAVLAAIIVMSVFKLFDFKTLKHLWKMHKGDFFVMVVTFLTTLIVGIGAGVIAGIMFSLFIVLYVSSKPRISILGRMPGTSYFKNTKVIHNLEQFEDCLILRLEDQLYFANAAFFKDTIQEMIADLDTDHQIKELILDAKSIHEIDSSGLKALEEVYDYLKTKNITLKICGAMAPFRLRLRKSGLVSKIGQENTFNYLNDAINSKVIKA